MVYPSSFNQITWWIRLRLSLSHKFWIIKAQSNYFVNLRVTIIYLLRVKPYIKLDYAKNVSIFAAQWGFYPKWLSSELRRIKIMKNQINQDSGYRHIHPYRKGPPGDTFMFLVVFSDCEPQREKD